MREPWNPAIRRGTAVGAILSIAVMETILLAGCATNRTEEDMFGSSPVVVAPPWAPAYDGGTAIHYYYFPDQEIYYDVWAHDFISFDGGAWQTSRGLPASCAGLDLYGAFVVVLDRHAREPWAHHHDYVTRYPREYYLRGPGANTIRQARGFNENGGGILRLPSTVRAGQHFPQTPEPLGRFPAPTGAGMPLVSHPHQGVALRSPGDIRKPDPPATKDISSTPRPHARDDEKRREKKEKEDGR